MLLRFSRSKRYLTRAVCQPIALVLPITVVLVLALTACGSPAEPEEIGLTASSSRSEFDNAQDRLDFVARYVSKVEPAKKMSKRSSV